MQRYAITLSQIQQQRTITLAQLESDSQMLAVRLGTLHGIHAPEFSDKSLFKTLLLSLQQEQYLQCQGDDQPVTQNSEALAELAAILLPLLPDRVRRTLLMPAR